MRRLINKIKSYLSIPLLFITVSLLYTNSAQADESGSIKMGSVMPTALGIERGLLSSGRVMLVTNDDDSSSEAYAQVVGLSSASSYGAHVHNLPCNLGGGGHYKNNVDIPGAIESNEIWVSFTTNDNGVGLGNGKGNFIARPEAQSIVIHDIDGGRVACGDLQTQDKGALVSKGNLIKFGNGSAFGSAIMGRSNGSTLSILNVNGLLPNTTYGSHVHNLPCDVKSGGSHYKIDPSIEGAVAENEIWLTLKTDTRGTGSNTVVSEGHTARPEAQSVVVHAPNGSRVGCANLKHKLSDDFETNGSVVTTAAGLAKGLFLSGYASMERDIDGKTKVEVKVKGLASNSTYGTHVHNLPCKLGGGGHYKINEAVTETRASNEIWPIIKTNRKGKGKGKAKVKHVARPEAQSIVIHNPADGTRIGCFDLD